MAEYQNPPVVVNALIADESTNQRRVLLAIRNQEEGRGMLELVGGFVEVGETLEEALRREVLEETRATVRNCRYFNSYVGTYPDGRKLLSVVFVVTALDRPPRPTEEVLSYLWVTRTPEDTMFAECDREAIRDYFTRPQ